MPYDIEAVAMSLPRAERAELARKLIASLDEEEDEIAKAWEDEARRRLDAYREGRAEAHDGEQVFADIKQRLDS